MASACDAAIGPDTPIPAPVIQSLLVAGDSVQTAWVEWRIPADSGFGSDVRPVASALVQLFLVLPDGSRIPFSPAVAAPGRFDVATLVTDGATYRLEGTVAGIVVEAVTEVPGLLTIKAPALDTVHFSTGSCSAVCAVPYHWVAEGADAYLYMQIRTATGQFTQAGSTRDTIGLLSLLRATTSAPDTAELSVFALESNAAAFLLPTTPKSSINGVFGLFGAASRATRWFVWD